MRLFLIFSFLLSGCASLDAYRFYLQKNNTKLEKGLFSSKETDNRGISDKQIKSIFISESIKSYPGSCPCPYFSDRAGRRCGGRSAWSRPGGYSVLCYESDISDEMTKNIRNKLQR